MGVRDILLQANSHPEPTPDWAIDRAANLAKGLGAEMSLGVCQVHVPPVSNWLANSLLNIDGMIAGENRKSADNAEALLETFADKVPAGHRGEAFVVHCGGMVSHWQLAVKARTRDMCVVPFHGHAESAAVAEGLVFETGRPVLLLPDAAAAGSTFERIAVAWDGSRVAARALADAMPLARLARSVSIVRIMGEKDLSRAAEPADAVRHLKRHAIDAEAVDVELEDRDAAATLQSYCERDGRDLLVMGAFGHSRARQFVLGGVTRSILDAPRLPVLMSH